jgi:hypothetical protein
MNLTFNALRPEHEELCLTSDLRHLTLISDI